MSSTLSERAVLPTYLRVMIEQVEVQGDLQVPEVPHLFHSLGDGPGPESRT